MVLLGGQFKSATHGQFKSAQGGQFDRILQSGRVELGIISESGEYYSLSGRCQLSAFLEALELLKFAASDSIESSQKKKIQAIVKKTFKF